MTIVVFKTLSIDGRLSLWHKTSPRSNCRLKGRQWESLLRLSAVQNPAHLAWSARNREPPLTETFENKRASGSSYGAGPVAVNRGAIAFISRAGIASPGPFGSYFELRVDCTRAAKSAAAPELGPFQSQKIPQRPEQRHLGICSLEIAFMPIHIELHFDAPSTMSTTRQPPHFGVTAPI